MNLISLFNSEPLLYITIIIVVATIITGLIVYLLAQTKQKKGSQ